MAQYATCYEDKDLNQLKESLEKEGFYVNDLMNKRHNTEPAQNGYLEVKTDGVYRAQFFPNRVLIKYPDSNLNEKLTKKSNDDLKFLEFINSEYGKVI